MSAVLTWRICLLQEYCPLVNRLQGINLNFTFTQNLTISPRLIQVSKADVTVAHFSLPTDVRA